MNPEGRSPGDERLSVVATIVQGGDDYHAGASVFSIFFAFNVVLMGVFLCLGWSCFQGYAE